MSVVLKKSVSRFSLPLVMKVTAHLNRHKLGHFPHCAAKTRKGNQSKKALTPALTPQPAADADTVSHKHTVTEYLGT